MMLTKQPNLKFLMILALCLGWGLSVFVISYLYTVLNVPIWNQQNLTSEAKVKSFDLERIMNSDLIFVGGFGRSGTTLMRAILDVHSSIRCGPEDRVVYFLLDSMRQHLSTDYVAKKMREGDIRNETIDDSTRLFIYNIIVNNGPQAKRLCMKDPPVFAHISYLHHLFPRAKFVYMVRDGRASVFSQLDHKNISISKSNYTAYLRMWNSFNAAADEQCRAVGSQTCMRVRYDDLVLETNRTMRGVLTFLNEPWEEAMLEHEKYIGSKVAVSKAEWSTAQIKKPVYTNSLSYWIDKVPYFDERELRTIAPMLETFGFSLTFNQSVIKKQKAFT